MAFPSVEDTNTSIVTSNVTEHTVNLPPGIQAGETLIVVFCCDGVETVTFPNEGTDWISLGSSSVGGQHTLKVCYRKADGLEESTITVTTGTGEKSVHASYRISGAEDPDTQAPQASSFNNGSTGSPNSPNLNIIGGPKDVLWITIEGNDRDRTVSVWPTNYSSNQLNPANGGSTGCGLGMATYNKNGGAEDPGPFTISSADEWLAITVGVHPTAGGATYEIYKDSAARILGTQELTPQSVARIKGTMPFAAPVSAARILAEFVLNPTSAARILGTQSLTPTSAARIKGTQSTSTTSAARITAVVTYEINKNSAARILGTVELNPTSAARILGTQSLTPQSAARIVITTEINPTSAARILGTIELNPTSAARILGTLSLTPQSAARILGTIELNPASAARILAARSMTPQSAARIFGTQSTGTTSAAKIITGGAPTGQKDFTMGESSYSIP